MRKNKYFYDKGNNTIYKILQVYNNTYWWLAVAGNNVGGVNQAGGYDRLFVSPNIIFGELETLKVLYVKV